MRLALNGATTMSSALRTDIQVAGAAGYDALEIWAAKLDTALASGVTLATVKQWLDDAGLQAHTINSLENVTFRDAAGWQTVAERATQLAEYAQALDCPWIVAVPGPRPPGVSEADIQANAIEALDRLATIWSAHRVGTAFEFLGFAETCVNRLDQAWAIVQALGRPDVALIIDAFHAWVGGSNWSDIDRIDPRRVAVVHLDDAPAGPPASWRDPDRVLPGLGVIPNADLVARLARRGWDGVVSVELFNPEYWTWEPRRLADAARQAAQDVIRQAHR